MKEEQNQNTSDIRAQHFKEMESLERTYYNKQYINDNDMSYEYLYKRENYKPLGQKWRPFFIMPRYSSQKHYGDGNSYQRYAMRGLLGLVCLKLGYEIGKFDSKDQELEDSKVMEFECEE